MLKYIIVITCFLGLFSCKQEEVFFQEYQTIPKDGWAHNDTISFEFDSQDSLTKYDFNLTLRNQTSYPYANIYLFVYTEFPNGKSALDTLAFMLADPSGKWYGETSGTLVESKITYKRTRIPYKGHYKMNVIQAMREEIIHDIEDVGLKIVKHKKS